MQAKSKLTGYHLQIQKATGAPLELLPILERIMREEVFHSTLDWQTAREFSQGAKKAHKLYLGDAEFYDVEHAHRGQAYLHFKAEVELRAARESGDAARIAEAECVFDVTAAAAQAAHAKVAAVA